MLILNAERHLQIVYFFNRLTSEHQEIATKIMAKAISAQDIGVEDYDLIAFNENLTDAGKSCMYDLTLCALGIATTEEIK